VAANAGNDHSRIATYASVGVTYGYEMLWLMVLITVCMGVVQEICVRLGAVTGKGFSELVRENFSLRMTAFILLAQVMANGRIIVSEFVGIAAAAELFGVSRYIAVPLAAVSACLLLTRGSHGRVEKILLNFKLVLFAYVAAAFLARPAWGDVATYALVPSVHTSAGYLQILIALIGTTITAAV